MSDSLITHEVFWRLGVFITVFVIFALTEHHWPQRHQTVSYQIRWPNNLGLVLVDTLALRLFFPFLAVGSATVAAEHSWGLLNQFELPLLWSSIAAIVLLDLVIYFQHVIFHHVPVLWRLHRVHHSDTVLDVTNGLRFHPIEILLSMIVKMVFVVVIGAPVVAVVIFEIVLNATALFNHSNTRIPPVLDKLLRWVLVTPDFHRVHHSAYPEETNSNYGFNTPIWDRLFGTYTAQPRDGHTAMQIGLFSFRAKIEMRLDRLLTQPFRNPQ